jgi:2,4-dienoyl-CoA reductase-like NADH-dependent reductase (Old Yellow Enzyme family)
VVFTEATAVEPRGRVTPGDLGLWHDEQVAGMRRLTDFLRLEGSVPAIQLAHAGRKGSGQRAMDGGGPLGAAEIAKGQTPWQTVSPTAEPVNAGWPAPHALTEAEIAGIVAAFAIAARRAEAAGFDIAEVHGAHGYLIASFLSPVSNTRNDGYGGDRAGRMRFALEVTRAVRAVWPARKPLFFRVSALDGVEGGWNLEDSVILSAALKDCGVDVVDCSSGGLTGSATAAPIPRQPRFQVPFAAEIRRRTGVLTQAVGLILDGPQAEAILQAGDADLIAVGRQALFDPFWALHAAAALGADDGYALWPAEYGWWLDKRSKSLSR